MIAEDIASTSKINSFHFSKSRAHVMLHIGQVERTLMEGTAAITKDILALERAALDRWGNGDPGGYLEINSPDVSYFDPFLEHRLDGLGALTSLYESIRGKVKIDQDEIINPRVQLVGGAAILTFEYASHGSEGAMQWNCTEVYECFGSDWKIVHSHWSFTKSGLPKQEG